MKSLQLLTTLALVGAAHTAAADPAPNVEKHGPVWSLTLAGGALAPIGVMRDTHQDTLVAGIRFGVRARIGIGVELAADYSPLPRKGDELTMYDVAYGTVAVMPSWTLGEGTLRLQIAGGGGAAFEQLETTTVVVTEKETVWAPAVVGQMAMHLHVTKGGGLVLMAGATRTFKDREYQYAWGMGGLNLEF